MTIDDELDTIYMDFNEMARCGYFSMIDAVLRGLDVENASDDAILLGYLTASLPMKSKLRHRPEFVMKCWSRFVEQHGTFEAARLIVGLF